MSKRRGIPPLEERDPDLAAEIVRLYQSGLSCRAVSAAIGGRVSHETCYSTVKRAGAVRGHGGWTCPGTVEYKGTRFPVRRYPVDLVVKVLRSYDRGTGTTKLSERYGLSVSQIEKWIARAGINRNHRQAGRLVARQRHGGISDEHLAELKVRAEALYVAGASCREVADALGVRYASVYYWLRRRGVMRRKPRSVMRRIPKDERVRLAERAVELYVRMKMTGAEVARHLALTAKVPVSAQTVAGWIRRAGVVRPKAVTMQLRWNRVRRELITRVWSLRADGLSIRGIAERLGCSDTTVRKMINQDRPRAGRRAA